MRVMRTLAAGLLAGTMLISAAEAQNRYRNWDQTQSQQHMRQALDELDGLINEAERARAADPRFLRDLRQLSQKYRAQMESGSTGAGAQQPQAPATGPYLVETFSDGNYTYNPSWRVISGSFQVLSDNRLVSAVVLKDDDREAATRDAGGNSRAGDVIGILSQILLGRQGNQASNQEVQDVQATNENAEIRTQTPIGNAFVMKAEISSRTTQGAIEFAISQGNTVRPGYGLLYRTSEGMVLIRRGSSGNETLAQVDPRVRLFDGLSHTIRWRRDSNGFISVEVDGSRVIRVTDTTFRDDFDGLSFVNRGGVHMVHEIEVQRGN